jgi:hypothetical protein
MGAAVHFDPATHTYTLSGKRIPGVTTVLKRISRELYRHVDKELMERAAALGTAVHKLIELDIAGTLDEEALAEVLVPYLHSWRRFMATSGFVPVLSEEIVWSERYGYAGQLDLFGEFPDCIALVDAKRCAQVPITAGPQTAGYEIALRERHPHLFVPGKPFKRFALQLNTDGTHRLVPFTDPDDARVFLSELTTRNFLKKHKLLTED